MGCRRIVTSDSYGNYAVFCSEHPWSATAPMRSFIDDDWKKHRKEAEQRHAKYFKAGEGDSTELVCSCKKWSFAHDYRADISARREMGKSFDAHLPYWLRE